MGIFDHHDSSSSSSSSNHTCPDKSLANPPQEPLVGSMSFHDIAVIIAGACTIISCLLSYYNTFRHAMHYSLPKEQKQVIRIVHIVPVFAVSSFLSVAFNNAAIYLAPLQTLYESFTLCAFFFLLLAYVQENDDDREAFFETSGLVPIYRKTSICVFQFPVVMVLVTLLTEITEATGGYCATSDKLYFAHIWVSIISTLTTGLAVMSVLKFYKNLKPRVGERKPMAKLIAFKAIVGITWLQNLIFSFLTSSSDLKPTKHMTYDDLTITLPNLIAAFEMVIFAAAFMFVFRTKEYNFKKGSSAVPLGHGGYQGGFLGLSAIVQACDIRDLIKGIIGCVSPSPSRGSYPTKAYGVDQQEYDRVELTAPENTQYEPYNPQYPAHEARYAQQVPQSYA